MHKPEDIKRAPIVMFAFACNNRLIFGESVSWERRRKKKKKNRAVHAPPFSVPAPTTLQPLPSFTFSLEASLFLSFSFEASLFLSFEASL
jgi:hypothetical protein